MPKRDRSHAYDFRPSDVLRDLERRGRSGGEESGDPCARGPRCESRDYQGNPQRCPQPFCRKDRDWIIRSITDLPEDYRTLRDELLPRSTQQEERVSGSKEPPLPLAADVQAFMREMVHIAVSWEEHVRAANRLSHIPAGRVRDEMALWRAAGILSGHVDSLISLSGSLVTRHATRKRLEEIGDEHTAVEDRGGEPDPYQVRWDASGDAWENKTMDGTQAALELLALHGRAWGMLGLSRPRRRITEVDCDECGAKSLFQRGASSGGWDPEVRCENCPAVYWGDRLTLLQGRIYEAQVDALDSYERSRRHSHGAA